MTLTTPVIEAIEKSVLCWLATSSRDHIPNVSPKEIFTHFGDTHMLIANIASPQSVRNILENPHVCVSFIDIWVQKGYQLKGPAQIIHRREEGFAEREEHLLPLTGGNFPFNQIISIQVGQIKPIIAPRYRLFPETTEEEQIASARKAYGLSPETE